MKHLTVTTRAALSMSVATLLAAPNPLGLALRNEPPADVIDKINNLSKLIGEKSDEVKNVAEDALKQAKASNEMSATVKEAADKNLTELGDLKNKLDTESNKLQDLAQEFANMGTGPTPDAPITLGNAIADHEDVQNFVKNGSKGQVSLSLKNVITSAATSAGPLIETDRVADGAPLPRRSLRIRQILTQNRTTSNMVEFARMKTRTNAAAAVAETLIKPESNYEWELAQSPVQTIAHWVPISRQAMDDAAQLSTEIDSELRYGLDIEEENQLFAGDGVAPNLAGLTTAATAYAAPFVLAGATPIDTVRLAALQSELADYPVDAFLLHPLDWGQIQLTKDGDGNYIVGNPFAMFGASLWGYPVVASKAPAAGSFMTGNFGLAATIYDRMDTEVLISSEDRDNFVKNMLTVRAEKRLGLAIKRGEALIAGAF